jgi:hypothetical protein
VDKVDGTPTTHIGRPALSDEARLAKTKVAIEASALADRLKEPYRESKRLLKLYKQAENPTLKNTAEAWLAYVARQRVIDEWHKGLRPIITATRLTEVLAEFERIPVNVMRKYVARNLILYPGPELDEAIAREELEGWVPPAERKAKEKAFTKRFGHAP